MKQKKQFLDLKSEILHTLIVLSIFILPNFLAAIFARYIRLELCCLVFLTSIFLSFSYVNYVKELSKTYHRELELKNQLNHLKEPEPIISPTLSPQKYDYFERINKLDELRNLDPIQFEKFVAQLFKDRGFVVQTTSYTNDEGIDLITTRNSRKAIVQCKRYKGNVGQPVIRDLYGAMIHTKSHEAYLITTGNISEPARRWAEGKPIHLIDGIDLLDWLTNVQNNDHSS